MLAGACPPRYGEGMMPLFTVGRGPVPRRATLTGDRPPRYGNIETRRSLLRENIARYKNERF